MGDGVEPENGAHALFDDFVQASTCRATLRAFSQLCEHLQLAHTHTHSHTHTPPRPLYHTLKARLSYWRANALWAKLDKRAAHLEYMKGRACANTTCVIIGAGPCGLRAAVELGFLGARVVLLEKRDAFSRNNVLHLWPFTIHDLRGLGAKKFHGKFCAGSIDHISIRQLQLVLLKVALLLGVEVHVNVEFKGLLEPPEDQHKQKVRWRMEVHPRSHPVNQLEFDVIIGADGRRNTLPGFRRKEFRGKLAIAITANFMNRNTTAEAKVEEISGVAFIFNQKFFQELRHNTGIDLENIVYYKDDTHYFVMTAKKQSLLEKGVILQDYADTEMLLSRGNVDQKALLVYAHEAANFSTNHQLPSLDFAINHYGQPDVAMFDFTCMYASENAALVRQRHGHQLLVTLVGDSLLEPFWPMGTGIARGFLAAMDSAWMVRSWALGHAPLEVLAERESVYRILPQTTPENINKNFNLYTVDPATRYPNINPQLITPAQVKHLIDTGDSRDVDIDIENLHSSPLSKLQRQESFSRSSKLLSWCQQQTQGYRGVAVSDLTSSWKTGLALCALIHHYRPDLIDFESLDEAEVEENTQLGLEVAELEFGISPVMTVEEMSSMGELDTLCMVMYLSQFYQLFKDSMPPSESLGQSSERRAALMTPASQLSRLGHSPSRKRNPKGQEKDAMGKRRKTSRPSPDEEEEAADGYYDDLTLKAGSVGGASRTRVRLMANQLLAKFEENASGAPSSSSAAALLRQGDSMPNLPAPISSPAPQSQPTPVVPLPTWRQRTQQQEQMSFRYKEKVKCHTLPSRGEQKFVQMYTKGVSSRAEQLTNQLQNQEAPKPVTSGRRESVNLRSVFASGGTSDVCFFCKNRVYVMERLSAEGLFFHRSCFQCDYCSSTLRLASYAYDRPTGKFYCKPHYDLRLSGAAQRKRPAPNTPSSPSERTPSQRTSQGSLASLPFPSSVDGPPTVTTAITDGRRSSVASLIEREAVLAKRVRSTPERIELENYRVTLGSLESDLTEEPEEVPEETLANHNLSLLVKNTEGSSSESDMEEEGPQTVTSELSRASWRQAVELHNRLRGQKDSMTGEEEEDEEEEEEGEVDEDDDHDDEDDVESSDDEDLPPPPHTSEAVSLPRSNDGTLSQTHCSDTSLGAHTLEIVLPDSTTPDTTVPDTHSLDPHGPASLPNITISTTLSSTLRSPTSSVPTPDSNSSVFTSSSPNSSSGYSPCPEELGKEKAQDKKEKKEREERERGMKDRGRRDPSSSSGVGMNSESTTSDSTTLTPPCTPPSRCLKECWDSVTQNSLQEEDLLGSAPRPAPIMAAVVVRRADCESRGSFGELLGDDDDDEDNILEDTSPPLSPQKPLQQVLVREHSARVEREKERQREVESRRELERAAMCITWEETTPLSSEPTSGKTRGGLDPRRLTESLPPLLLASLQGGSIFSHLKGLRDTQGPSQSAPEEGTEEGRHRPLWKAVFSGYKKDRKKKERTYSQDKMAAAAPSEHGRKEAARKEAARKEAGRKEARERKSTGRPLKVNQSWLEESELTCSAVMERCSLNPRANTTYVPHALAFRRAYAIKKRPVKKSTPAKEPGGESSCPTEVLGALLPFKDPSSMSVTDALFQKAGAEEQLDARITRRVQRAARKQAKQEQLKRLHRAQIIQRQLEQVEEKQRQLEERGVAVEKALRGEADYWGDSSENQELDLYLGGMGRQDNPDLMQQWFKLVQQKNILVRYESELVIFARELELEDRQSRLQQELRERMAVDDHLKGEGELVEERLILGEMLEVVEQRDALVSLLEEHRQQEHQEDRDLEAVMLSRGLGLHWA
ncbi:protein-methionine sulfoxide oxidase mical3b isoform X2 [Hypomesus transpacificus]|uniref:protein-methionine sulfoxide oxidase mical3b isoform X2 n=1 Tax=Hypomesus transpacificus TaxID=137520 RepID=UPI001F077E30|nr:protein-methionine sulfoxide oxidase mical3b isoform X2 [Hypomesus transpacificus]